MTNETNKLKTYTMQQLYAQPLEPVEYLVDGLLTPGLYILGGSPKVGKSWMALQLCLAVCGGKAFLGRKTQRSEVLYLALEDGPQRLLCLRYEAQAGDACDTSDGSDGCDRYSYTGGMPSPASRPSLAS